MREHQSVPRTSGRKLRDSEQQMLDVLDSTSWLSQMPQTVVGWTAAQLNLQRPQKAIPDHCSVVMPKGSTAAEEGQCTTFAPFNHADDWINSRTIA